MKNDIAAQVDYSIRSFSRSLIYLQLVDEEMRLISRQDDLEKKLFNVHLKGLSLLDTLELLLINSEKDAESLKKDFSIPDKRYWWVKIQAYAKKNAWTALLEFGRKPTSPIGYEVSSIRPKIELNAQEKLRCKFEISSSLFTRIKKRKVLIFVFFSSHSSMFVFNIKNSMKLVDLPIAQSIHRNSMMNVYHSCLLKFSKSCFIIVGNRSLLSFVDRMVDEAIASAVKIKSLEALHFIEAKCQLNDASRTKILQARDRLQDNDNNPFNVFKLFNRGARADE